MYRKFGIVYSEAFGKYESDVMDSITENFEAEAVDQLLDQYDTPESVSVGLLPINCSITFLCLLDKELGYKYVFQTRLTKETVGERLRGPMGLFSRQETYINNDMQLVFDRLQEYYK